MTFSHMFKPTLFKIRSTVTVYVINECTKILNVIDVIRFPFLHIYLVKFDGLQSITVSRGRI